MPGTTYGDGPEAYDWDGDHALRVKLVNGIRALIAAFGTGGSGGGTASSVAFTNPTTTSFRQAGVGVAPVTLKAAAGSLYGYNLINPNAVPVFAKFYDNAAPVVGTTTPLFTVAIPANGAYVITRNGFPHGTFTNAIKVAVTTGLADTDATAPASGILVQAAYQ